MHLQLQLHFTRRDVYNIFKMFVCTSNVDGGACVCIYLRQSLNDWEKNLEGPTRKPRHASVFSTHSDTQSGPAFHCIRMFKGIFSTRAFLKQTDTLSTIA